MGVDTIEKSDSKFALTGKIILFGVPVIGVLGIVLPLALGQYDLFLLGLYMAIPMVSVALIYLKYNKSAYKNVAPDDTYFKYLAVLYALLYLASVVLLIIVDIRPYFYYVIFALMAVTILFEIMLFEPSGTRTRLIMAQVMFLVLNIIWGVSLKYYYFINRTDILVHSWLADDLLKNGYVTELFGVYQPFPLWHILTDYVKMVTGLDLPAQTVMFIICGLIYAVIPVFVYLILNKLTKDTRISLLSSLFLSFYPFFLIIGMSSIARSVVPIFVLSIILLSLEKYSRGKFLLALILIFTIIVFHTVSILFVLMILLALFLLKKVYDRRGEKSVLNVKFFIIAIALTIGYWELTAGQLVNHVVSNLLGEAPSGVLTSGIYDMPLNELANYAQYSLLLVFILAGIVFIVRSKTLNNTVKVFSIIGLVLIPVTFPGPMMLINKFAHNFSIDRFSEYGFIFISFVAAYGFSEIFRKSEGYAKATLSVIFIVLVILSISNDFIASDNPLIKREFYTYYLTENEITGIGHIYDKTPGFVMSDYVAIRYMMNSPYSQRSNILEVDHQNMTLLRNNDSDVIIIREGEFNERPLRLNGNPDGTFIPNPDWGPLLYYYRNATLMDNIGSFSRVYDSGELYGIN